jgi:hypothetical protein
MAYFPIAKISPQYDSEEYANWWLKAYTQGTTTPILMALDAGGVTTVAKLELNEDGFINTAGDAIVIPYINEAYDLWLFPTEAEADANDTSNAIQLADNIDPSNADSGNIDKSNIGDYSDYKCLTVSDMTDHLSRDGLTVFDFNVGEIVETDEYSSGNGGGGKYKVTTVGTTANVDLPNGFNIIVSTVDATKCFVLRVDETVISDQFGTIETGDTTAAMQAAIDYADAFNIEFVEVSGSYTVTNLTKLNTVKLVSVDKLSTITIGSTVFNVPFKYQTNGPTNLYVATTGSDSTNCGFDSTVPFATPQAATKYLPTNIANDTVINLADGSYGPAGGQAEFGRPAILDLSIFNISALRDSSLSLNTKAGKLIIRGESEAGTILDGQKAIGTHTGSSGASVLTDSTKSFTINELVGYYLVNTTDNSSTTITANTATTITGTLSGGTDNDWDAGDSYKVMARYGVWSHESPGVQLENLTVKNCYFGIMGHQNDDITLRDVTTSNCVFGRGIESNSRMEVLRGSNGTASEPNTRNYFIKNGQLQENDSSQASFVENGFLIDGDSWVYCLRVKIDSTASKNVIQSTGSPWFEFDNCNIYGGGSNFISGVYGKLFFSNGCMVGDFSSAIFSNHSGYAETSGLCHFYNNQFIVSTTKGMPVYNLGNCDANAATGDHDGANNSAVLTDTSQDWVVDQFIGLTLNNTTDGSTTTVTSNTETTITGILSGGTDNDWDTGDSYVLTGNNAFGVRIRGGATSVNLDPDIGSGITDSDKIATKPTSGLIYRGTTPPSDANTFYERGAIVLNEAAAVGQPQGWICTTKGYGGVAVFTAMPNL